MNHVLHRLYYFFAPPGGDPLSAAVPFPLSQSTGAPGGAPPFSFQAPFPEVIEGIFSSSGIYENTF